MERLMIDEAIAQEKELAEHCKRMFEEMSTEDKLANKLLKNEIEYHEQLAERLEELKAYRTLDKTNFSDGYNRGVDDFAELLKDKLVRKYANANITQQYVALQVIDWCDEIAEQLKAGGNNA